MTFFRLLSSIKSIYDEIPRLGYGMFNKKFPIWISKCMNFTLKIALRQYKIFIRLLPSRFRYIFLMAAHSLSSNSVSIESVEQIKFHPDSTDLVEAFVSQERYYRMGHKPNFEEVLCNLGQKSFLQQNQELRKMSGWAYWTFNHKDFVEFNDLLQQYLTTLPRVGNEEELRFLPFHTSNLGHLTMLFLYISYHNRFNPERTLILPRKIAANNFFLSKILHQSKMKIQFEDLTLMKHQSPTMLDTLYYSLDKFQKYRTEIDGALRLNRFHQELEFQQSNAITLNENELELGFRKLSSEIKKNASWFVTLHVREPRNGDLTFSQARDVNIQSYRKLAEVIRELGGEVIRMGDPSFPKLDRSFPAFDYAHSKLKSEFMDVWLWANSKLWIGNVNGATLAPIAFNRPRLITNQWYWNDILTEKDLILRKHVAKKGQILSYEEVLDLRISRCMDRKVIEREGYALIENTSDELIEGFLSIYSRL